MDIAIKRRKLDIVDRISLGDLNVKVKINPFSDDDYINQYCKNLEGKLLSLSQRTAMIEVKTSDLPQYILSPESKKSITKELTVNLSDFNVTEIKNEAKVLSAFDFYKQLKSHTINQEFSDAYEMFNKIFLNPSFTTNILNTLEKVQPEFFTDSILDKHLRFSNSEIDAIKGLKTKIFENFKDNHFSIYKSYPTPQDIEKFESLFAKLDEAPKIRMKNKI